MILKNNKNKSNSTVTAASTLLTLATIVVIVSSMATTTPVAATTSGNTTTTTSASLPTGGIELSPQPIYQGYSRAVSENPINETHISSTNSGNGTLTLPDTGETINVTTNGSALISFATQSIQGEVTITTEEGDESVTARFYEIVQFNSATGEVKGIVIAVVNTNSTGILAPLNGRVVAGIDNIQPSFDESLTTLWEWESGITLLPTTDTTTEEPPLMNTTTNATGDTNATAAPE